MDLANRAVSPPYLAPGRLINFSADNIDINDGTLDGKHTLHATLYNTHANYFIESIATQVVTLKSMTPQTMQRLRFLGSCTLYFLSVTLVSILNYSFTTVFRLSGLTKP